MSKGPLLVMLVACAFCAPALAQEPPAPARVGTDGVIQPRLVREVIPEYPKIAQSARVSGRVIVEATIDATGRVSDAKVTGSIPLLDVAAYNAVRQWQFAAPVVGGQARPVVTTITLDFRVYPATGPAPGASVLASPSGMPPDFAVAYSDECGSGLGTARGDVNRLWPARRTVLTSSTHDLDGIYGALSAAGLLSGGTGYLRWPDRLSPSVTVLADRIEVAVPGEIAFTCSDGRGAPTYELAVRAGGIWTKLWSPAALPEFSTAAYEQQLSAIRTLVEQAIAGKR